MAPREAGDDGDHNAGCAQRILTDHVRRHSDVIARDQRQQQCRARRRKAEAWLFSAGAFLLALGCIVAVSRILAVWL
jgi:hypothetical protein